MRVRVRDWLPFSRLPVSLLPVSSRALLGRSAFERQMDAELAFHIDAYATDLERRGTPRADALRHARLVFGGMDDVKERCRHATGLVAWDRTWQDLRAASRMMRRQASFTLAVVLTLALCIGVNTAVFSVVDAVLFRPLPFPEPARLVHVQGDVRIGDRARSLFNQRGTTWEALRDGVTTLDLAAFIERPRDANMLVPASGQCTTGEQPTGGGCEVTSAGPPRPELITQQRVSAGFFDVLGVRPAIGRGFDRQEDVAGGPAAVVLSHAFWTRMFGERRDVLGQSMLLRGAPHRIVGVMPPGFAVAATPDVWTPLRPSTTAEGSGESYSIIGRLRPGATWAQAEADVMRAGHESLADYERAGVTVRLRLASLHHTLILGFHEVLVPLWGAAGLVLLVGCVNIAGLMLARGGRMRREIATRMALGSGRGGVVRQLLVESLALALCGGLVGTLVGLLAIGALRPLVAEALGVWQPIALDLRVLTMTLVATLATSVIFGLAPVLDACRVDLRAALSGAHALRRRAPATYLPRCTVVVAEIALSVVLLVAAGLLLRTFAHLQRQDAGFDPQGVLAASVSLEDARYASREPLDRLFETSLARIRALPGVAHAAVGLRLPYEAGFNTALTHVDDVPVGRLGRIANVTYVTPEYFDALGIRRVQGRTFDARDGAHTTPVVVVNEAFARGYLRDRPAIGRRLELYAVGGREVVGVVGTVQHAPRLVDGRPNSRMPAVYLLTTQTPVEVFTLAHAAFSPSVIARTADGRAGPALGDAMRRALASVDPQLPIGQIRTAHDLKMWAFSVYRFEAAALTGFAALALLLAAVGIYGIVAHGLAERRRELSIRSAVGATRWQAVRAAAAPGLRLATTGIIIGCLLGWLAGRMLRHLVVGVTTADLLTFTTVAGTLFVVAAAASLLPALAAARLDLADTLRAE